MTPLEKTIEEKVGEYAKSKGWLTYKFTSPMRMAVPDRLYITPKGVMMFIEFKRLGQVPKPAQEREHARLRAQHVLVYVVDNIGLGKMIVDCHA
jgi:hypothetical protein